MHQLVPPKTACPFCAIEGSLRTCMSCREVTFLDGLIALGSYGDPVVQGALKKWKYYGDQEAAELVRKWLRASAMKLSLIPSEVITYIPLHWSKKNARGFDQAEEIASVIAEEINKVKCKTLIRKKRNTPQAWKSERIVGDLDKLFKADSDIPETVLLCDDVFTSGATMDAAAKALKGSGVQEVWGLVLAKGSP